MWSFVGASSSNYTPFGRCDTESESDEDDSDFQLFSDSDSNGSDMESDEQDTERHDDSDDDSEEEHQLRIRRRNQPIDGVTAARCAANACKIASAASAAVATMALQWTDTRLLTTEFVVVILCMDGTEVCATSCALSSVLTLKLQVSMTHT